jgi:hypothetical protein
MVSIIPFPRGECAFDPKDVSAMSTAFDEVCQALGLPADAAAAREGIAVRIIELARCGERRSTLLRDQVLREAEELNR